MSVNLSFSSNASLPPSLSSAINIYSLFYNCFNSTTAAFSITINTIISILILVPLYIFVLYLGLQQWRQQCSGQTMSHCDVFTFHMVVIELLSVFGYTLMCCGVHADVPHMVIVGVWLFVPSVTGQTLFHILTCVERYLAVVHPITYLSLRKTNWIRLRNVTIGCVWLMSFVATGLMGVEGQLFTNILSYCTIAFSITVISFCSLSVLCVLIRPGPGEGGGGRQRVDQSKLKAFYTIMAILGVLLVRFCGSMVTTGLYASPLLGEDERCALWLSIYWFCLPSSLVSPLLFLQRAGKLLCCKNNNQSGQGSD